MAGRGNVPDMTQVRPALLVPVVAGPYGGGYHSLEYKQATRAHRRGEGKLRPYRRMLEMGCPMPMLMVSDDSGTAEHFLSLAGALSRVRTPCGATALLAAKRLLTWQGSMGEPASSVFVAATTLPTACTPLRFNRNSSWSVGLSAPSSSGLRLCRQIRTSGMLPAVKTSSPIMRWTSRVATPFTGGASNVHRVIAVGIERWIEVDGVGVRGAYAA